MPYAGKLAGYLLWLVQQTAAHSAHCIFNGFRIDSLGLLLNKGVRFFFFAFFSRQGSLGKSVFY